MNLRSLHSAQQIKLNSNIQFQRAYFFEGIIYLKIIEIGTLKRMGLLNSCNPEVILVKYMLWVAYYTYALRGYLI